ncbi:MAG: CCA tRNA nucleotidyltransferase [Verrucomicrobiota bacterium]|nr:CCA tRNA nucleotidyltransferase [Verrucomicrobiota bacterium]
MEEHPHARYIVETLVKAGFVAYYAGGWVRDFLLNHPSDDIDIATNAPPETVQTLFSKTVPIGIAFGIILVVIDGHPYEVATFRQDFDYKDARRPSRVEFTTAEEDAKRRDFTINGMFYDPLKSEVIDYVAGKKDLEAKIIRAIGNPHERIREDRLRMIRAARFACRFHFSIDPATEKAIRAHATELFPAVAIERIVQELEKGLAFGKLRPLLIQLHDFGLLATIFPSLKNTALPDLEHRLEPLKHFPPKVPLIACLLELFPNSTLEEQLKLVEFMKLSNLDRQFTVFLFHARGLTRAERPVELAEWAYFYANKFSSLSLQIIASRLDDRRRAGFLKEHEEQLNLLRRSIDRIHAQDPLVKSNDLAAAGIPPSKEMGILLKEAERISINQQIEDKSTVLNHLKNHPAWP